MEKDIFNIDKKQNFHMVGDMSIPCSIILSGVQIQKKGFKKRNRYRMRRNVTESCRRI